MRVNFPQTCSGYFGVLENQQSLASRFIGLIQNRKHALKSPLAFPVRTPGSLFFKEVCRLQENPEEARNKIQNVVDVYRSQMVRHIASKNSELAVETLNCARLLLHFAQFNQILALDFSYLKENDWLESQLIQESAHASLILEQNQVPDPHRLFRLIPKLWPAKPSKSLVKAATTYLESLHLNGASQKDRALAVEIAKRLLEFCQEFAPHATADTIMLSHAFRTLANFKELGETDSFLSLATNHARSLVPQDELEKVAADENLITSLRAEARWHFNNRKTDLAIASLTEVIQIDPFGSVGHFELGLALKGLKHFAKAIDSFLKAARLGPPAPHLSYYQLAQCQDLLGEYQMARDSYYLSAQADLDSVEAWIKLVDLLDRIGAPSAEQIQVLKEILEKPARHSQLSEPEIRRHNLLLHSLLSR